MFTVDAVLWLFCVCGCGELDFANQTQAAIKPDTFYMIAYFAAGLILFSNARAISNWVYGENATDSAVGASNTAEPSDEEEAEKTLS